MVGQFISITVQLLGAMSLYIWFYFYFYYRIWFYFKNIILLSLLVIAAHCWEVESVGMWDFVAKEFLNWFYKDGIWRLNFGKITPHKIYELIWSQTAMKLHSRCNIFVNIRLTQITQARLLSQR